MLIFVVVAVTVVVMSCVTVTVGRAAALFAASEAVVMKGFAAGATVFWAGFVEEVGAVTVANTVDV